MNWKQSLDRYLTSEPEDNYTPYCEQVLGNEISNEFHKAHEDWLFQDGGLCDEWLWKLYDKGIEPSRAAAIIERAHRMYVK